MVCGRFMEVEDQLAQQVSIMGLLMRGINKLMTHNKHTDKYIHKKCREFSQLGLEVADKLDIIMRQMREGEACHGKHECVGDTTNAEKVGHTLVRHGSYELDNVFTGTGRMFYGSEGRY